MFAQIFTRVKTCGDIYKSVNLWYNRNSTNEKYGGVNLKDISSMKDSLYVEVQKFKSATKEHASAYICAKAGDA